MTISRFHKIAIFFILFTSLASEQISAQIEFRGRAPHVVQTGERFQLIYTVNARTEAPTFNLPDALKLLSGPGISESTQMQLINGAMSSSFSKTYTYVIEAITEGKYTIEPARITAEGKTVESNRINIEVVKGTSSHTQSTGQQTQSNHSLNKTAGEDDFFVRVNVDRRELYQGEAIVATLKLYTTLNLSGFEKIEFPNFTGFFKEEIETVSQIQLQRENVNGRIYQSGVVAKYLLMPQKSGTIDIDPFTIEAIVTERVRTNDPFESFFGGNVRRYKVGNSSPVVKINVKPLPTPRPDDFTGGVGQMRFEASISRNQLKENDALNLKVKITGTGNIKFIDNPKIEFHPDFEVYDPKKDVNVRTTERGSTGVVLWDYVIIPRHAGKYTIPQLSCSYFDPASKTYKKVSAGPFDIEVEQGTQVASQQQVPVSARQDIRNIGSDIRFIQTGNLDIKQKGTYFFGTPLFWTIYILPVLIFVTFLVFKRKQAQDRSDTLRYRNKRAAKLSRNRLKSAKKYVNEHKDAQVYDEILRALWQYLSDKFGIDQSRFNRDTVYIEMKNRNIDKALITKISEIADICEMARYAPTAVQIKAADIYSQAVELLVNLERAIK